MKRRKDVLKSAEKIDSSEMTEEGLQQYVSSVSRRYELVDQILQSVREGNEHQAMAAMDAMGAAGRKLLLRYYDGGTGSTAPSWIAR